MKICIIIPVHNESKKIGRIVSRIKAKSLDIIVIDDGSVDSSGNIAEQNGAIVIKNTKKQGKGSSLKEGFGYSLQHDYDGVITMDGDGQHDVSDLEAFFQKIKSNPDSVIVGNRMSNAENMPIVRKITNQLMSFLISVICRHSIPDSQCGYRYISRDILANVNLVSSDFEIETEVLIKASKKGYKIFSVPVKTIYQDEVSKINPLKDTIRFISYLFREIFGSNK